MAPRRLPLAETIPEQPMLSRIVTELLLPRGPPSPAFSTSPSTPPSFKIVMPASRKMPGSIVGVIVAFVGLIIGGFLLFAFWQYRKGLPSTTHASLPSPAVSRLQLGPSTSLYRPCVLKPLPPLPGWDDEYRRQLAAKSASRQLLTKAPVVTIIAGTPTTPNPFTTPELDDVDLELGDRITPLPPKLPPRVRVVSSTLSQTKSECPIATPKASVGDSISTCEPDYSLRPESTTEPLRGAIWTQFANLRRKQAVESKLFESVVYHDFAHDAKLDLLKGAYFHAVDRHREKTDLAGQAFDVESWSSRSRSRTSSVPSNRKSDSIARNYSDESVSSSNIIRKPATLAVINKSSTSTPQPTKFLNLPSEAPSSRNSSVTTHTGGLRASVLTQEWRLYEQDAFACRPSTQSPGLEEVQLASERNIPRIPRSDGNCCNSLDRDNVIEKVSKKIDFWRQQGELDRPRSIENLEVPTSISKPEPAFIKKEKTPTTSTAFWISPEKGLEMLTLRTWDEKEKKFSQRAVVPGASIEELPDLELLRASKQGEGFGAVWALPRDAAIARRLSQNTPEYVGRKQSPRALKVKELPMTKADSVVLPALLAATKEKSETGRESVPIIAPHLPTKIILQPPTLLAAPNAKSPAAPQQLVPKGNWIVLTPPLPLAIVTPPTPPKTSKIPNASGLAKESQLDVLQPKVYLPLTPPPKTSIAIVTRLAAETPTVPPADLKLELLLPRVYVPPPRESKRRVG